MPNSILKYYQILTDCMNWDLSIDTPLLLFFSSFFSFFLFFFFPLYFLLKKTDINSGQ